MISVVDSVTVELTFVEEVGSVSTNACSSSLGSEAGSSDCGTTSFSDGTVGAVEVVVDGVLDVVVVEASVVVEVVVGASVVVVVEAVVGASVVVVVVEVVVGA